MGQPTLDQESWRIGDDDNADPDACTWRGSCGSAGYSYPINTPFMVRITVANKGNKTSGSETWSLWRSANASTPVTPTQVTTSSALVEITGGTPTDGAATDAEVCAGTGTRVNGEYNDANDTITGFELLANGEDQCTEFQFCVQFLSGASGTYYFYIRYLAAVEDLDAYTGGGAAVAVTSTGVSIPIAMHHYQQMRGVN